MSRKRKIAVKSNEIEQKLNDNRKEIFKLLHNVQTNEAYHKKYAKELQKLYEKVSSVRVYQTANKRLIATFNADGT